ncbi:hypothetical protein F5146DRAFT_1036159 [Armillaria mellea]|nr:hypothetical protein F5146DRAFT_1036159 [Armillaria mellea]
MGIRARSIWCVTVTFLQDHFLIGFVEAGMTLLGTRAIASTRLTETQRCTTMPRRLIHEWDWSPGGPSRFTGLLSHSQRHFRLLAFLSPVPLNEHVRQLGLFYCQLCLQSTCRIYTYFLGGTVYIAVRCIATSTEIVGQAWFRVSTLS